MQWCVDYVYLCESYVKVMAVVMYVNLHTYVARVVTTCPFRILSKVLRVFIITVQCKVFRNTFYEESLCNVIFKKQLFLTVFFNFVHLE